MNAFLEFLLDAALLLSAYRLLPIPAPGAAPATGASEGADPTRRIAARKAA